MKIAIISRTINTINDKLVIVINCPNELDLHGAVPVVLCGNARHCKCETIKPGDTHAGHSLGAIKIVYAFKIKS